MKPSDLHVISVISNPMRYESRVRTYLNYRPKMLATGVTLWEIEASFGERDYEVTTPDNPHHIQVRCDHALWLKEAMVNRAINELPRDWKYVAWVDADITFDRQDWAMETLHALQHYSVVQPFSHAVDYGPKREVLQLHESFGYLFDQGFKLDIANSAKYGKFFHPGYTWAWRRDAWEAVGGMLDLGICGAGDHHMACALIGEAVQSMPGGLHPNYYHMVYAWQDRAKAIRKNIGYVPGTIHHEFHGWKPQRNYQGRWEILKKNNYDPYTDVKKDWQGMLNFATDKIGLRDDLRKYFSSRDEDAR
jgi:hypothetical protein